MPFPEPFREYVENVCGQIRWKKVRPAVAEELEAHLDDQRQALMEEGASEEDAVKETLRQMGDPVDVGGQLDRGCTAPNPSGPCWRRWGSFWSSGSASAWRRIFCAAQMSILPV